MNRPVSNNVPVVAVSGKAGVMPEFVPVVRPEDFRNLRLDELKLSMSEFGKLLKDAIRPGDKPFNRQYVDMIEKGKTRITEELQAAFFTIAGNLDGVPAGIGGAIKIDVLALPNQITPGSYIPANYESVRCALPGCPVIFVKPKWSGQKYHCPECKKKMDQQRRKALREK